LTINILSGIFDARALTMILCLDISQRTKDELEKLVQLGGHRNYSEAVAIAVANQLVLQSQAAGDPISYTSAEVHAKIHLSERVHGRDCSSVDSGLHRVPELFSYLGPEVATPSFAESSGDSFLPTPEILVDRWIFGQHNKLLPVKATCRAMARLMSASTSTNLGIRKTASQIASEAVKLGDYLRQLDQTSSVHRDDALSFAFPYSGSPNSDKARLRYANQFVVSSTKQGNLTGLPIELRLVGRYESQTNQVSLTDAGWLFARMRNPILDDGGDGRRSKFSDEEIDFLLAHIRDYVPAEAFAYKVILEAIAQGANMPEKLDDALEVYLPQRQVKPFTRAFLTTQRAGVVSRMIELGLIRRVRDGINASYIASASTFEYSPNTLRKVV
jgi:hypothetical protein